MNDEFKDIMIQYNEAATKLIEWGHAMLDTPFSETQNGKDVLEHIEMIAKASTLLNLKAIIIAMEDLLIKSKSEEES